MYKFLTLLFIISTLTPALASKPDTSKIKFSGKDMKVAYSIGRQVNEVTYTLKNGTKQELKFLLVGAYLVRGKHFDPLDNSKILIFAKGRYRKQKFIELRPGQEVKFTVKFKPFTLYTGTDYTVRTMLQVEGIRITEDVLIKLYKQSLNDPNRLKDKK